MDRLNRILAHAAPEQKESSLSLNTTSGPCTFERNPGIPLDMAWVNETKINTAAVKRRAADHLSRRSVKKQAQLGWNLRLISLIDLTTLAGNDSPSNVFRMCQKARNPLRKDVAERLGFTGRKLTTGAVCVYPNRVKDAVKALEGSGMKVASVAAGFPAGQTPLKQRLAEIRSAVADGALEIDIVLSRNNVVTGRWDVIYDEVKQMREACGEARLKTILATGEHPTFSHVYKASLVSMMAGSDFIKTSTGKEPVNATIPVALIMCRAIRDYHERTGYKVGFKPAGGISNSKTAIGFLALMLEELGQDWTHNNLFRIGASSLLLDVERQLEHGLSGRYAAKHYFPMG